MRLIALTTALTLLAGGSFAAPAWDSLPATPVIEAGTTATVDVDGAKIFYRVAGKGDPVVLLHGGPANQNYWAGQFDLLAKDHTVIAIDTRGHGRSTLGTSGLGYDRMADDVIAVLDAAKIAKADIVGWSDGGITGLDLAMRHPDRVGKVLAFGANVTTDGVNAHPDERPAFAEFVTRSEAEYNELAGDDADFKALNDALGAMYAKQPNWSAADLGKIKAPVLIADGDHDEAIKLEHTVSIAQAIPGAELLIVPGTSHFAFLQRPDLFNKAMLDFLAE